MSNVVVVNARLKNKIEELAKWKDDICSLRLKDIDECFWFSDEYELQEFLHVQERERFFDELESAHS